MNEKETLAVLVSSLISMVKNHMKFLRKVFLLLSATNIVVAAIMMVKATGGAERVSLEMALVL